MTLPAAVRRLRARHQHGAESGVTLIELLVAVALMGIAFVGILSGIGSVFRVSQYHRRASTSETLLRTYSEGLKDPNLTPYVRCPKTGVIQYPSSTSPPPSAPTPGTYRAHLAVLATGSRLSASQLDYKVELTRVEVMTGSSLTGGPTFATCTSASQDKGAQRLTLVATPRPGAAANLSPETVVIVKRDTSTDIVPTTSTTVPGGP